MAILFPLSSLAVAISSLVLSSNYIFRQSSSDLQETDNAIYLLEFGESDNDRFTNITTAIAHVPLSADCMEAIDPVFKQDVRNILHLNLGSTTNQLKTYGVKATQDELYIMLAGFYYVYTNVNFRPCSKSSTAEFTYQTWFYYVHREHPNSPMKSGVMLRGVYTSCSNCSLVDDSSSSGGVFQLVKGDLIQVTVSGRGLVGFSSTSSYVGLFLLAAN